MKRRNILIVIVVLIVILLGLGALYFIKNWNSDGDVNPNEIIKLDTIEGYGYSLEDRDTKLFKEKFEELRAVLNEDDIDFEKYAKLISELYIIDLYTISNKVNQYDVGGKEFLLVEAQENFDLKVRDTIYKYVEDNSNGSRTQELPEVLNINVEEIVEKDQMVGEEKRTGYEVKLSWEYVKDMGYDESATIEIAKIDDLLYIISQSASKVE